jgi:hypothetical protein
MTAIGRDPESEAPDETEREEEHQPDDKERTREETDGQADLEAIGDNLMPDDVRRDVREEAESSTKAELADRSDGDSSGG